MVPVKDICRLGRGIRKKKKDQWLFLGRRAIARSYADWIGKHIEKELIFFSLLSLVVLPTGRNKQEISGEGVGQCNLQSAGAEHSQTKYREV